MNTLVMPVIEENASKAAKKISDAIITVPEKEKVDKLRTECSELAPKHVMSKKSFETKIKNAEILRSVSMFCMYCGVIFLIGLRIFYNTDACQGKTMIKIVTAFFTGVFALCAAYSIFLQVHGKKYFEKIGLLKRKKALLALCNALHGDKKLEIHVFDEATANGLHLFAKDFFDENRQLTDEAKDELDKKYPDGYPGCNIRYIETENRDVQPTLKVDFENNEVVFTASIDYRMFLNKDSVFTIRV